MSFPPATRTVPSGSKVAVWNKRPVLRRPVAVQVPLAGLYTSATARTSAPNPPATSTVPSGSKVAVCA